MTPRKRIEFSVGQYRCMFGPSDSPSRNSVWLWNGYYWQIEIAEAHDLDGARNAMQFKLAERKAELARIEKAGMMVNASSLS